MLTQIGDYKIIKPLGHGGMGEVYLAEDNLQRKFALKLLSSKLTNDEHLVKRFSQEAKILSRLKHKNIVGLHSFFVSDGAYCIVMEHAKGITLKEMILKKIGIIPEKRAARILLQTLYALSYAHSQGIIHRDIKPSNIMIDDEDNVKILDFGISKIIDKDFTLSTTLGMKLGTLLYMSPEQVSAPKDIDARTDIYSLGITFFEMLTGKVPVKCNTDSEFMIMREIVEGRIPDPREYYPGISQDTVELLFGMVEKDRNKRIGSCDECIRIIDTYMDTAYSPENREEVTDSEQEGNIYQEIYNDNNLTEGETEIVHDETESDPSYTPGPPHNEIITPKSGESKKIAGIIAGIIGIIVLISVIVSNAENRKREQIENQRREYSQKQDRIEHLISDARNDIYSNNVDAAISKINEVNSMEDGSSEANSCREWAFNYLVEKGDNYKYNTLDYYSAKYAYEMALKIKYDYSVADKRNEVYNTIIRAYNYDIPADRERIFYDGFTDNSNGWSVYYNVGKYNEYISEQNYCLENYSSDYLYNSVKSVPFDQNRNFEIETSIKIEYSDNCDNGLDFGRGDGGYYLFSFSGENEYQIYHYQNEWKKIISGNSDHLNGTGSFNTLTVRKIAGRYYFYINKHWVYTAESLQFYGDKIGFTYGSKSKIRVYDIKVYYLNY